VKESGKFLKKERWPKGNGLERAKFSETNVRQGPALTKKRNLRVIEFIMFYGQAEKGSAVLQCRIVQKHLIPNILGSFTHMN